MLPQENSCSYSEFHLFPIISDTRDFLLPVHIYFYYKKLSSKMYIQTFTRQIRSNEHHIDAGALGMGGSNLGPFAIVQETLLSLHHSMIGSPIR